MASLMSRSLFRAPLLRAPVAAPWRLFSTAEQPAAAAAASSSAGSAPAPPLRFGVKRSQMEAPLSEAVARVLALDNASRAEVTQARVGRALEAFAARPGDTGSSSCQIAALTVRIEAMKSHMGMHRKDFASRRGMEAMMSKRRKLLKYMKRKDLPGFKRVVVSLNLASENV